MGSRRVAQIALKSHIARAALFGSGDTVAAKLLPDLSHSVSAPEPCNRALQKCRGSETPATRGSASMTPW